MEWQERLDAAIAEYQVAADERPWSNEVAFIPDLQRRWARYCHAVNALLLAALPAPPEAP